jgi:hypothetical protein
MLELGPVECAGMVLFLSLFVAPLITLGLVCAHQLLTSGYIHVFD